MADVTARAAALSTALDLGGPWLDPAVIEQAGATVDRSLARSQLGADHTVVALVGATGSGKSSLFNALARMEIAEVGARRPLTSLPMACVWGEGGSQELLDWLEVPETRRVTRESVLDADNQAPLHGLVLLDLPDHDSTEVIHRVEVDRLVTMVDLMVWVVDPQKYADDALHSGYLQRLVGHDGVMVVVLNQIDRLSPDEAVTCERDLRRLLDGDGLAAVPVIPVSATRGDGVDELRTLLAGVVQDRFAIAERVGADLQAAAEVVLAGLAPAEPGNGEPLGADRLVIDLAAAAGVPTVLDALAAEYRRWGWVQAGWPLLRWLRRLIPSRLGHFGSTVTEQDLKLIASEPVPLSAPAQRPRVELAVDDAVSANADLLPQRWADEVRVSVSRPDDDLVAALDERVAAVDLALAPPSWWRLLGAAQYLLSLAAVVGAVWLLLIGATSVVGREFSDPPSPLGLPLPLLLLVVGLVAGALLAAATVWLLSIGARRRRFSVQARLHVAIEMVAHERVIVPIRLVLGQHRATRQALAGVDEGGRPQPSHRADPAPEATSEQPVAPVGPVAGSLQPLSGLADDAGVAPVADARKHGKSGSRLPV
jgi:GTP-binding protein EngB required for normal cell division